ncbi:MAG: hypothetical protein KatS3mg088_456 [Patescibacteria group bacterium]|nr:MAG: hypothetical protein KatS3mg088_456 [Patescibacteria group bacterium]
MNTKFLFNKIVIFLEKYLNIFLSRLLVINKILFPYLISLTCFFLFLESYTYIGFLRKFFLVDSRFFLILSIFSVSLLFYLKHARKDYKADALESLVVNLNAVLFLPFVVLYFIMIATNAANYPNYVFANYHIQPQNFVNLVYLSFVIFLFKVDLFSTKDEINKYLASLKLYLKKYYLSVGNLKINRSRFAFIEIVKKMGLNVIFLFLILFYFVSNFLNTFDDITSDLVFILTHRNYTYEQKMERRWGLLYKFISLIERNTRPGDSILLPENKPPHSVDGRIEYYRYFLGGRKLVSYHDDLNLKDYDYIVITKGYLHSIYDGPPKKRLYLAGF